MHLGDSRLQYEGFGGYAWESCDLHLGDSRLQFFNNPTPISASCDLHLGDSRLQLLNALDYPRNVVICI